MFRWAATVDAQQRQLGTPETERWLVEQNQIDTWDMGCG